MISLCARQRDKLLPVVVANPENVAAWDWLAMAFKGLGNFTEALRCYHAALSLAPSDLTYPVTELLASIAHTYGLAGRTADGERILAQLLDTARTAYVEPVRLAFVFTALGRHDEALEQLSAAADLRQWELAFVRSEPWFQPLQGTPAFAALVGRIGFPSGGRPAARTSTMVGAAPSTLELHNTDPLKEEQATKSVRLWVGSPAGFWGGATMNLTRQSDLLANLTKLADVVDTISVPAFFLGDPSNKTLLRETGGLVPGGSIDAFFAALHKQGLFKVEALVGDFFGQNSVG